MPPRAETSCHCRTRILSLTLLLFAPLLAHVARASEWPYPTWTTATPASQSMDVAQLQKARDYALQGGGSGMIVRHGYLVYSWGSPTKLYEMRSTTKSFGATMLGLAIGDGRVSLSGKAQSYFADVGVPPDTNIATGWLGDITIMNLATHTAGFPKTAAEAALIYKPGTKWGYSDGGADWLADVLTTRYHTDLYSVMNARVFTPLGIRATDLSWRDNAWRSDTLDGVKRREFGSGIITDVNAMARLGLLYLRGGVWRDTRILTSSFVQQVHTVQPFLANLPITNPTGYPAATHHYGLLWWNNADGRMAGVPTDAYWTWGLDESLIVVIPSLDIVVARAGLAIRATPATDPANLEGFIAPIVASVQGSSSATSAGSPMLQATAAGPAVNAPPLVDAGVDRTVVLPQNTITLAGSVSDDGLPGGAPTVQWTDASGMGAVFLSPTNPASQVTFPQAGTYVLRLSANDGQLTGDAAVTVTVLDPAATPTKMTAVSIASSQFAPAGAAPENATWLSFGPAVPSGGEEATLRVRISQVNTPGTIEVHRVLGTWDPQSVGSSAPPPIDPVAVASYTVEPGDAGLALETDVSAAVSSWQSGDAAKGFVLISVTGDAVISANGPGAAAEIRLDP